MPLQIRVEVVYAGPRRGIVRSLILAEGASVGDALRAAATDAAFAGVDLPNVPVGVYGKIAARDQTLKDGDRVEIYRRLALEPKLARRARLSKSVRS